MSVIKLFIFMKRVIDFIYHIIRFFLSVSFMLNHNLIIFQRKQSRIMKTNIHKLTQKQYPTELNYN